MLKRNGIVIRASFVAITIGGQACGLTQSRTEENDHR
jgi:hypothetical protein